MAQLFNGTDDSIEAASAPVTAVPLTVACWFYLTSTTDGMAVSIGTKNASSSDRFGLNVNTTGVACTVVETGISTALATIGATIPQNTWVHAAAVFPSNSSRTAYYNGTAGTENTLTRTPSGLTTVNIGARYGGGVLGFFLAARIAEVSIWNAALTADEIASLAKGFPCRLVRPSALVFYAPLIREKHELRNGIILSETGTGTIPASHSIRIG